MKLLEYEAKSLLKQAGLTTPRSVIVTSSSDTPPLPTVLKSQVPVGGRGKAGGVRVIETSDELPGAIAGILALSIKGFTPKVLLAEEKLGIQDEHYVCLLVDRDTATIRLIAHKKGGMEVEDNDQNGFLNIPIDNDTLTAAAATLADHFGYTADQTSPLLQKLYDAFVKNDATLLEINPLVYGETGFVCGDCKMELDDAAAFRHPEWTFEDRPTNANFVTLDPHGTVATIANGAGLAMATVDAVAAAGMKPANFLDIGGGANTESVLAAFKKIMDFPNVHAIVINIFAGITRCDEVAKAIIAAKQQIDGLPPLFIRLAGTNFEEAVDLLTKEGIMTLATLEECLTSAKEASRA